MKHKQKLFNRRRFRNRSSLKAHMQKGTLRLSVFRSNQHIYAQIIDDMAGRTLASASSVDKVLRAKVKSGGNVAAAELVGKEIADKAKKAGIKENIVFDRGPYLYHGRVKAVAEGARAAGLKF